MEKAISTNTHANHESMFNLKQCISWKLLCWLILLSLREIRIITTNISTYTRHKLHLYLHLRHS